MGLVDALEGVPNAVVAVAALLTHLGDPPVLLAGAAALSWGAIGGLSRRDGARLLAVALAATALVVALKTALALPRPPAAVRAVPADGYGFPSGHATGAAAVYGAGAVLIERGRRRTRLSVAGAVVATVALSRVVLGVHYVVDVLAGVVAGTLLAVAVLRVSRQRVAPAFWLAAAVGASALLVGLEPDTVAAAAGTGGAAVAWLAAGRGDGPVPNPATVAATLAVAGGTVGAVRHFELGLAAVALGYGAAAAAVVAVPGLVASARRREAR